MGKNLQGTPPDDETHEVEGGGQGQGRVEPLPHQQVQQGI